MQKKCNTGNINCRLFLFNISKVPGQFVESMLEVHQKYTEMIQGVFHSDQQFVGALDKVTPDSRFQNSGWIYLDLLFLYILNGVTDLKETACS